MRTDERDAEVVMRLPQRLGELGADVVPVLARGQAQLGKALRADHVPYAVEPSGHGCGVDLDADRACDTGQRAACTSSDHAQAG